MAAHRMTVEELHGLPVTIDLLTAAKAFGIGRTVAYSLARRNAFPCRVFRVGARYLVAREDLFRALGAHVHRYE